MNDSPKNALRRKFSAEWQKYYKVKLFDELNFQRQCCTECSRWFWSQEKRSVCPDHGRYDFIGEKFIKPLEYVQTWQVIEKFFEKNGHHSIPSYPVICKWFPGLYFTVASIVAFQRSVGGKTVFEMPSNPLIIPQSCLRFNDIQNVGVTGRHGTNFVMVGQHSIYDEKKHSGYWKDRCIELDFRLLTDALGIPQDEITFMEDVWLGPNAFGYSLEYFVRGLELGNAVFTEFLGTPENFTQMDYKVVDMGAGLERFTWLSQGTPTYYDTVFDPVLRKVRRSVDYDRDFFNKYARLAGVLNIDEVGDYRAARKKIATQLNVTVDKLNEIISPVQALYAIADHSKTVLYAITDGGLPSNVGGGYNIRVVLRRALSFIDEFKFDIDLFSLCKVHALQMKKMNPKLMEGLDGLKEIIELEKERMYTTREKGKAIVKKMIEKRVDFTLDKMAELYESNGITPEFLEQMAKDNGINVKIPANFYKTISEKHMSEKKSQELEIDLSGLPDTQTLFYETSKTEFDAKVLKIIDNKYVILDRTCFYGRSGGQEPDTGTINSQTVYDAEKIKNIIVHFVENPNFSAGDTVHGEIDAGKHEQLMKHHTAIHIINGAAQRVLGRHVWQAGAHKTDKKAHIDITHYKSLTDDEIEKIENVANAAVKKRLKIIKKVMSRHDAERAYGFRIYQGGAIPSNVLRINDIAGFDVEACSGTHCNNTKEVGIIVITSTERIQDGMIRINIMAGKAAENYIENRRQLLSQIKKMLGAKNENVMESVKSLFEKWKKTKKESEKSKETKALDIAKHMRNKMHDNTLVEKIENADQELLQNVSKILSTDETVIVLFGVADKIYIFGSAGASTGVDAGEIVKNACEKLGGRGGGIKSVGRGIGVEKDKLESVITYIRNDIRRMKK